MVDMVVDLLEVMLPMLEITRKIGVVMELQEELKMRAAPLVRHGSMVAVRRNSELQQPVLPYKEGTVVTDPMMLVLVVAAAAAISVAAGVLEPSQVSAAAVVQDTSTTQASQIQFYSLEMEPFLLNRITAIM
jgi:hypothetical protein